MSEVKEFRFEIKEATRDYIIIADRNLQLAFMLKKLKTGTKLYIMHRSKTNVIKLKDEDLEEPQIFKDKICLALRDFEELSIACNEIASGLFYIVNRWEDFEAMQKMREALEVEKPSLIIKDGDQVFEIYKSDGLIIPIAGGIISIGSNKKAIIETTYVYGKVKRLISRKGTLVEAEDIKPVMAIAEYVRELRKGELSYQWVLKSRKLVLPLPRKVVEIHGRPVKVNTKSISKDILYTMADIEVLARFKEGHIAKPLSEIYGELKKRIERFVNFYWDPRLYDVFACHIIATYFYNLFSTFPELFLYGPYGSGKTRTGLTWAYSAYHGLPITDPSEAAVYRSIEAFNPSMFFDESVLTPRLMRLLSSGYKKGPRVPRVERSRKEQFILSLYNLYSPKCLAYVEPPEEMLLQRCIVITMKIAKEVKEKRDPEPEDFRDIRNELYLARLTRANEVFKTISVVEGELSKLGLSGREMELWLPILTIARLIGREVYENVKSYMLEDLQKRKEELYSEEKIILKAIEKLFEEQGREEIVFQVKDLQDKIREILIEEGAYNESTFRKQWEVRRLGKILTRMGIKRTAIGPKENRRYARIVNKEELKELSERFGYVCRVCNVCNFSEDQSAGTPNEAGKSGSKSGDLEGSRGLVSKKLHTLHTLHT